MNEKNKSMITYALIILGAVFIIDNILKIVLGQSVAPSLGIGVIFLIWGILRYRKNKKIKEGNYNEKGN